MIIRGICEVTITWLDKSITNLAYATEHRTRVGFYKNIFFVFIDHLLRLLPLNLTSVEVSEDLGADVGLLGRLTHAVLIHLVYLILGIAKLTPYLVLGHA